MWRAGVYPRRISQCLLYEGTLCVRERDGVGSYVYGRNVRPQPLARALEAPALRMVGESIVSYGEVGPGYLVGS